MAKKKAEATAKQTGHKNKLVGLRLEERVRQAVQEMADSERRSLASMAAILVEEALAARGVKP